MKTLLSIAMTLALSCFILAAEPSSVASSCADGEDTTGTGGSIPGMGWGNQDESTSLSQIRVTQDTSTIYDLSGKKATNPKNQIVIKNNNKILVK